jgi:Holliday junction resolvase RusA-like endonuclease
VIEFEISGDPVPKGRPLFSIIGKGANAHVHVRTPPETVNAEAVIRSLARPYRPRKPLAGALLVSTVFVLTPPQRFPDDRSRIWPHVRPDDDNLRKLVLDALNGMFWFDDAQICGGTSVKIYGTPARTIVRIRPLTTEDADLVQVEIGADVSPFGRLF